MQKTRVVLAAGAAMALGAPAASGAELNLSLELPDVLSQFIDVDYDAGTNQFTATGFALELDDDGVGAAEAIAGGTFDLTATIDAGGNLGGGTITIGGTVAALGFNSGTLLTGTLTDFGFPDAGGDPLEFLFDVTGGDLAALYAGRPGGVILAGGTGFNGSFATNFTGGGTTSADTAPVPTPGALVFIGAAGLGLCARRRR